MGLSVNSRATALAAKLIARADELKIGVTQGELGETLIDAGAHFSGSVEAGLAIAEICMGGLGAVSLFSNAETPRWPWSVAVRSSHPVIACLASQYAGWRLADGEGKGAYAALGSGPARALARTEAIYAELGYIDTAPEGVMVIEADRPPPRGLVARIALDCALDARQLTFIYAPTQSLAGGCQVAARSLEVALHKAHELKFPLERIVEGMGCAPLPPPHPNFVAAMGRTNDAIIYAGRAHLYVKGPAAEAKALAERLPSCNSRDFGRPFAEVFRRFKGDFYAIDPHLFSPAEVIVTALESGESFHGGGFDLKILDASFGA